MKTLLILLFSLASVVGCAANSPTPPAPPLATTRPATPKIAIVLWSPDMAEYVEMWADEAARRYEDAVVVFCHGGDIDHEWKMQPMPGWNFPVKDGIAMLRKTYGNRQIVMVTCNPGAYPIPPGSGKVAYIRAGSVWLMPWREQAKRGTGDVFDLVENH